MENIAYIGLSQQMALKQRMDVVANNVANMTTPGFKAQEVLFKGQVARPKGGDPVQMVVDQATFRRTEQGPLSQTHNPLDFALQGDGYFSVQTPEGVRYTRAGNFSLNAKREIVTQSGFPVLGSGGSPIAVPEGTSQITVDASGAVSTVDGEVGKIGVSSFDSEQALTEVGDGLYEASEGASPQPAKETNVIQGAIESSNVQPIIEMNKMIEILRDYQSVQRMLQTDHERQRTVIQRLSRLS